MPSRLARLILMTPDGEVVGYLPPIPVDIPWRQEVESVVRAAHKHYGVEPLLDQPAFLERVPPDHLDTVKDHWNREWSARARGCDPARATNLLAPIAAARQAVIYQRFLDNIEPSEQIYHRGDPADWLRRTAELLTKAD